MFNDDVMLLLSSLFTTRCKNTKTEAFLGQPDYVRKEQAGCFKEAVSKSEIVSVKVE